MKDDRLISLNAAIDALNEYFSRIGKLKRRGLSNAEKAISLDTVGAIKSLPSAQRWIPVTKRLPENDDECLTILEDGLYYVQAYSDGEWYYDDVVAWMPLPEPYQEKE